ncbi:hypothetical protein Pmani_030137 [Petrolisthes manimaculis]|uniref:Uncharacterized protein n=1 Tax=Petrolisthes manimaculis TaxID=1843537 RepID=A0AAE1NYG6_9EUCA|nr:hypothetical protein Pmani_030137 [Petrolisthes manimaculis]
MKMPCLLSILCLISAVTAGPGWPAVIEVREGPSYPRHLLLPSHFDTQDTTSSVFTHEGDDLGNTDDEGVQRDVVMDGSSSSGSGGNRPSVVIRGIQEQLMEDLLRMEQDLLLIRRLLGQGHLSFPHGGRRPLVQSPSSSPPWSFPVLPPVHNPWWTEEEDEEEEDYFEDPISGQDSPWFNFPALGFNRPIFPDIPAVPSGGDGDETPSFHDLPDNYDNSTHNVHVVNGSRVEVNTTTNKKTGDGFNSFFHHQVIHIRPDQDTIGEVPEGEGDVPIEGEAEVPAEGEGEVPIEGEGEVTVEGEAEVPAEGEGEVPAEGEGEVPAEGEGEVPVEEDTFTIFPTSDMPEEVTGPVDRVLPQLPEVENEVSGNSRQVTETPTRPEEVTEGWEKGVRVLRGADAADDTLPEPKTSAYVINSIQRESYDDDDDDDEVEEPDLSGDTRVNHVRPKGKKGVSMMEPEAEIFNRKLVLKEAKTTTKKDD